MLNVRRLHGGLLLTLFLLFAQQGVLRHEYSHYGKPPAGSQKKVPADPDHCPLCLAYAHLSGAARSDVQAPVLLSHLAFHCAPSLEVAGADTEVGAPRSRGPPRL
jgi:hypothetical protein